MSEYIAIQRTDVNFTALSLIKNHIILDGEFAIGRDGLLTFFKEHDYGYGDTAWELKNELIPPKGSTVWIPAFTPFNVVKLLEKNYTVKIWDFSADGESLIEFVY